MPDPRTSVAVPPQTKKRLEKLAKARRPPIGWTQELVLQAEENMDRKAAPRLPMASTN